MHVNIVLCSYALVHHVYMYNKYLLVGIAVTIYELDHYNISDYDAK